MENIELSIKNDYVDWGLNEGIREIFQNSIDADAKGYKMDVDYDATSETLTVGNENAHLPKQSLLLGYTTKRGDIDQIGSFGEGYKLGCLGLLKAGCQVKIINKEDTWIPKIVHSSKFDEDVLAFEIHSGGFASVFKKSIFNGIRFEISGVSADQWAEAKKQFLIFEEDLKKIKTIETPFGSILNSLNLFGCFYINGILVEKVADEKFAFGYNFKTGQVQVDRDRKMINRYQTKELTGKMWVFAANQDEHFVEFETLLKQNSPDVQNLRYGWNVTAALKQKLAESFTKSFGERAIPVLSNAEVELANHIGKLGMVYGDAYVHLIQDQIGDLDKHKSEFAEIVNKEFDTLDLDPEESANLFQCWNILAAVRSTKIIPTIKVVEFADNTQLGIHSKGPDGEIIMLSRSVLKDFGQTLRVIIHEAGHRFGKHESKEFQDFVEETFRDIVTLLLKRQYKVWNESKTFTETTM